MLSLRGYHWFIICLLRYYTVYTISSRFPLFHYLFVTLLLCSMLRLSMPLFLTSLYYVFNVSIVLLSVCYVTALFYASTVYASVSDVLYYFFNLFLVSLSACYVTILSLKGFHC